MKLQVTPRLHELHISNDTVNGEASLRRLHSILVNNNVECKMQSLAKDEVTLIFPLVKRKPRRK